MLALDLARTPPRKASRAPAATLDVDSATIDARALALFDNTTLRNQVHNLEKVELASVWRLTLQALSRQGGAGLQPLSPLRVHQRLIEGLCGESLLISASMFLNTLADVERYFGISFKTIKARLGSTLDTAASERVMRAARATLSAAQVLGDFDAARAYMHTRNFALGGATPAELVKTADGERIVLNELQAHAEGGPL